MSYSIHIDEEIAIGDKVYSVFLEADLEYSHEEDPECTGVEITEADVSLVEGELLPLTYEGRRHRKSHRNRAIQKLTEAIDGILWDAIQMYSEDNYQDLIRDLQDAYDERDL
jgi:hypothetical protein